MDNGWIKIYRSIQSHWIWKKPEYLKAWITILLTVNFEDKRVLIEGELIECKRGQSLLSLYSWTIEFGNGWTMAKTRTFLKMLQKDSMIVTEGLRKTTRLTVCNYDNYQVKQQRENKEKTNKKQGENKQKTTTKEVKNDKNIIDKKKEFQNEVKKYSEKYSEDMLKEFFIYWSEETKDKKNLRYELQKTWNLSGRLVTWYKNKDKWTK